MAGYAITWELNLAGPWGTAAWLVTGTVLTLAMAEGVYKLSQSDERAREQPNVDAIPKTAEEKCKRYAVRIHAQGTDCGGTSRSTIGKSLAQGTPVTVVQGLALSAETQGELNRAQLKIRLDVIAKAHKYIQTGPTVGGRFGPKSFPVLGEPGGIRYDVDCFGDGPSFVS